MAARAGDSVTLTTLGAPTIVEGGNVARAADDAFGEQKPRGQIEVRSGRPHDHRERLAVQADLEGRFLGDAVGRRRGSLRARPQHVDLHDPRDRRHGAA